MQNNNYDYQQRKLLREQRNAMRSSHMDAMRQDSERRSMAARQKRASDRIPVKWYDIGPRVAGIRLRGMTYAGSNRSIGIIPCPHIGIPSLVDPKHAVEVPDIGQDVPPLMHNITYEKMSPLQRGRYLQFLASEKTLADTDDIGYAFLYLYGLERRLLVDIPYYKQHGMDEVSHDEHVAIAREVLRLDGEFRNVSESFHEYASALLLYDGTLASDIVRQPGRPACVNMRKALGGKNVRSYCTEKRVARLLSYDHMMLAHMTLNHVKMTTDDIAAYAVLLALSGRQVDLNDVADVLDGRSVWFLVRLVARRLHRSSVLSRQSLDACVRQRGGRHGRHASSRMRYVPASPSLGELPSLDARMRGIDPSVQLPTQDMQRIVMDAFEDIRMLNLLGEAQKPKSKDIASVPDDVVLMSGMTVPIYESVTQQSGKVITMPADTMRRVTAAVFPASSLADSKSVTKTLQSAYDKFLSPYGKMPLTQRLCEVLGVTKKPSQKVADGVIAFSVPVRYGKRDGKQSTIFPIELIGMDAGGMLDSAWVYGWFVGKCGLPEPTSKTMQFSTLGITRDVMGVQMVAVLATAFATAGCRHALSAKSYVPMAEMDCIGHDKSKSIMFACVRKNYGANIPPDVLELMEKVYGRLHQPKSNVLYDYQASGADVDGTANTLDESVVSQMVSDTAAIQDILSESMGSDDEDDDVLSDAFSYDDEGDDGTASTQSDVEPDAEGNGEGDGLEHAIIDAFGDGDEMPMSDLLSAIMSYAQSHGMGTVTHADAMGMLADANDRYDDTHDGALVDIDGPTALLNA